MEILKYFKEIDSIFSGTTFVIGPSLLGNVNTVDVELTATSQTRHLRAAFIKLTVYKKEHLQFPVNGKAILFGSDSC